MFFRGVVIGYEQNPKVFIGVRVWIDFVGYHVEKFDYLFRFLISDGCFTTDEVESRYYTCKIFHLFKLVIPVYCI